MPAQHSELKRWLFLNDDDYVCLVVNQNQKQRSRIRPQTIAGWNSHLKHSPSVAGSRRCQQGRSCLCSVPLVWPRASFVQTQLGSPAGEGGLDNITVTTRRTCLGYFQNARGGRSTRKKCSHSNKEACVQTASGTPFRWARGNTGFARNGHMRRNGSMVHTSVRVCVRKWDGLWKQESLVGHAEHVSKQSRSDLWQLWTWSFYMRIIECLLEHCLCCLWQVWTCLTQSPAAFVIFLMIAFPVKEIVTQNPPFLSFFNRQPLCHNKFR